LGPKEEVGLIDILNNINYLPTEQNQFNVH
jgi:hypothetical protein